MVMLCSHREMEAEALSNIILNAPAWARVGLTVRNERLREKAAIAMAETILVSLHPPLEPDRDQLALPL